MNRNPFDRTDDLNGHFNDHARDSSGFSNTLHWHILGGNNKSRIGGNSGLCLYRDRDDQGAPRQTAILFDAGVLNGDQKNPEDPALVDSDTIIPDLSRFLRKQDGTAEPDTLLDAIFVTHSHSDHIGAIPFMILLGYELPPVFATPYTARRLEQELANMGVPVAEWPDIYTIAPGKPVAVNDVDVTAFWVSHSTPQSVGFFIETDKGSILNPGDFKLDPSVLWGPAFSEDQLKRIIGGKQVDLLLLDSTGADRDIKPTTEEDVRDTLRELMQKHPDKRFVIAVMSGFEENMASIAKVAAEDGRTLWVSGWSHEQSLAALKMTGMSLQDHISPDLDLRVLGPGRQARDLAEQEPSKSVVLMTGGLGHPGATLTRAAEGRHNALELDPEHDIVLFCTPSIPGFEGTRERLLSTLRNKGFQVLTRKDADLYAHAHARLPEMIEMVKMVDPKTVAPIHGSDALRTANAEAMEKLERRVLPSVNGSVIVVDKSDGCHVDAEKSDMRPRLIGFKTLQGDTWNDRHYMMVDTTAPLKEPANGNAKKRPNIFKMG